MEKERLFVPQNQLVKNLEIGAGPHTLQPSQFFGRIDLPYLGQKIVDLPGGSGQLLPIYPHSVISSGSFHAPSGVIEFAKNHRAADLTAPGRIIRNAVLLPAQEDIPCAFPAPHTYAENDYNKFLCNLEQWNAREINRLYILYIISTEKLAQTLYLKSSPVPRNRLHI